MENTKYIVDWHNQSEYNTWFILEKKKILRLMISKLLFLSPSPRADLINEEPVTEPHKTWAFTDYKLGLWGRNPLFGFMWFWITQDVSMNFSFQQI